MNLLFICCFPHFPPPDPTLTIENVTEVMGEVGDWERVVRESISNFELIPEFKVEEIKQQPSSEKHKGQAVGEYWIKTDPGASWEKLAEALYNGGEERALCTPMQMQYLLTTEVPAMVLMYDCDSEQPVHESPKDFPGSMQS